MSVLYCVHQYFFALLKTDLSFFQFKFVWIYRLHRVLIISCKTIEFTAEFQLLITDHSGRLFWLALTFITFTLRIVNSKIVIQVSCERWAYCVLSAHISYAGSCYHMLPFPVHLVACFEDNLSFCTTKDWSVMFKEMGWPSQSPWAEICYFTSCQQGANLFLASTSF